MAAVESLRKFFSAAKTDVSEIRGRISDLIAEREKVATSLRDRQDIEADVDRLIENAAGSFDFAVLKAPGLSPRELPREFNERFATYKLKNLNGPGLSSIERFDFRLFEFLAAWEPEKLKVKLLANVSAGMTDAKRTSELARIDRELLAAEISEELACRDVDEAINGHFPRRREATTAILLAPTAELEKGA